MRGGIESPSLLLRAEREGVGDGSEADVGRREAGAVECEDHAADEALIFEARIDLLQAGPSDRAVGPDVEPELDRALRRGSLVPLREQIVVAAVDRLESPHHDRADGSVVPHGRFGIKQDMSKLFLIADMYHSLDFK